MKISVVRNKFSALATCGKLTSDVGFSCFTLEPAKKSAGIKPRLTDPGTYDLVIRWSHKFGMLVPHVEHVPDFEQIEIHIGNYPKNTDGCTLVGFDAGVDYVGRSKVCWEALMKLLVPGLDWATLKNKDVVQNVGTVTYTNVEV
jgi:hypothetical protein